MQVSYVKKLAEELAGESVNEVILTVPPYFSQFERDSVVDAIEIAGLKTLALVNHGIATVDYAMTRTFSTTPEYHIIYDVGVSSTRATVVSFTGQDVISTVSCTVEYLNCGAHGYQVESVAFEVISRPRLPARSSRTFCTKGPPPMLCKANP
jgi:molecular chaperone DnaK (HSP70)